MQVLSKFFGILLFLTLMLVKVSGFHVYSHDHSDSETIENCDICDLALENQTLDFQAMDYFNSIEEPEFSTENKKTLKDEQFNEQFFDFYRFSRPPPTPLV